MFYKKLAVIISIWYFIYTTFLPFTIYAQEIESTPLPTPVLEATEQPTVSPTPTETPPTTPDPVPTISPSPEPIPTESTVVDPTPEVTPTDSVTPEPSISPEPSPYPTNTATTASETIENPSPTQLTDSGVQGNNPSTVDQTANTQSTTTAESNTGNNSQNESQSTVQTTGDAVAVSDSITVANLSEINSNLITVVETILTSSKEDINLYQALMTAIAANPNLVPPNSNITVDQNAQVDSLTTASANSGENSQNAVENILNSGDAIAIANSITAANLNLVGSNVILAIINILVDYDGNIILPNDQYPQSTGDGQNNNVNLNVNQYTNTVSTTNSSSITGENIQSSSESASLATGNATSFSNSETLSNVIQITEGLGYLILNNIGSWSGELLNWNLPGEIISFDNGNFVLFKNFTGEQTNLDGDLTISTNQEATVSTTTQAQALTGGNTQAGELNSMTTGRALTLANNFTLTNLTAVKSSLFIGIINIVGNFRGNIITAYPKLELAITDNKDFVKPGEDTEYVLTVTNAGTAQARNIDLKFSMPETLISENTSDYFWTIGNLEPSTTQTFRFFGKVPSDSQDGTKLLAKASAETSDVQETTVGNNATDITEVNVPTNPPADTRTPYLTVSAWNNSGEYILPGDTLLVEIVLVNSSPFIARNVKLKTGIKNNHPIESPESSYQIGDIRAGGKAIIKFNLNLTNDTVTGDYHIEASATGEADSGDMSYSNTAISNFRVGKSKIISSVATKVSAESKLPISTNQVLGVSTPPQNVNSLQEKIIGLIPYFLLFAGVVFMTKKKFYNYLKNNS